MSDSNKEEMQFDYNLVLDPLFWERCWYHSNRLSPIVFNKKNQRKWQSYWNSISDIYQRKSVFDKDLAIRTLDLLEREGILNKEFTVLDIGCGTGTYTLPLAERVSHVYALDSAKEMINKMMEVARQESITNITAMNKSWYRCGFKSEFDLVFASFCPAIRDTTSLMKMHRASRQYLCYITACKEVDLFKEIRNHLWEKITGQPFGSYRSFDVVYPFNFLYTKGFNPSVRYLSHSIFYEDSIENQIIQYEKFFEIFTDLDKNKLKLTIRRYLERRFKDAVIKTDITRKIAIMFWGIK